MIARLRVRHSQGFTIIEMMIAVSVVAALSAAAIPSMSEFAKNSAMRGYAVELMDSIVLARSEAIKRGSRVILCRTADPSATSPSCGGNTRDWSTGWLVFVAENADDDFDLGTDILLHVGQPAPPQITVRSNSFGNNYLVYKNDGTLDESAAVTYAFCDNRGESFGRQVNVSLIGRPALTQATAGTPIATCRPTG